MTLAKKKETSSFHSIPLLVRHPITVRPCLKKTRVAFSPSLLLREKRKAGGAKKNPESVSFISVFSLLSPPSSGAGIPTFSKSQPFLDEYHWYCTNAAAAIGALAVRSYHTSEKVSSPHAKRAVPPRKKEREKDPFSCFFPLPLWLEFVEENCRREGRAEEGTWLFCGEK